MKAKVGEFYRVGMDESRIEKDGLKPLDGTFAQIAAIADSDALARELGRLHRQGTGAAYAVGVGQDFKKSDENIGQLYQGGLGLPERDYYVSDDPHMKGDPGEIPAARGPHVRAGGDAPAGRRGKRPDRPGGRDAAGQGIARRGRATRPERQLSPA